MRRAKVQLVTVVAMAIGALLVSATAMAQTSFGDKLRDKDISVSVGIGLGAVPDYEGSDDYEVLPLPILTIGWGGGRYANIIGPTAKVNLVQSETWDAGPMLNFRSGRDNDVDEPSIKLMREIDDAVELGAFLTWKRNRWNISASALQDISDEHEGFLLELSSGFHPQVASLRRAFNPTQVKKRTLGNMGIPGTGRDKHRRSHGSVGKATELLVG